MPKSSTEIASQNRGIRAALETFINKHAAERRVAVLLSGGADSTVVALAAHHLGRDITAISFKLQNQPSWDFATAKKTSSILGWNFVEVIVPEDEPKAYFKKLIQDYGCKKKTEVEVLYPFLFLVRKLKHLKFQKVLTGFSSPLPDSRQDAIKCEKDPVGYWLDQLDEPADSSATMRCIEFAAANGIELLQPLNQNQIKIALAGTTAKDLYSPYYKHQWKNLYRENFERIGLLDVKRTPNLQAGGGVESFFAKLLSDPEMNPDGFRTNDVKRQLSILCRSWAANQKPPTRSIIRKALKYQPYLLRDVHKASSKALFTVVSTFAGGGGSSTGYRLAGGKVLVANEFIPAAIQTYRLNYPDTPVVGDDIRRITRNRQTVEKFFEPYGVKKGELDIFDGSPPCATFSTASGGRGEDKMDRKNVVYSDGTQSRIGYLIHDYVFMANVLQPKVCVMENVPGIARSPVFHAALDRLRSYGYLVQYRILVSSDYAVPQSRKRLFVIAVRPDVAMKAGINTADDLASVFPDPFTNPITIKQALEGITVDPAERNMLKNLIRKSSYYELIKMLPFEPTKHTRINDIDPNWKSDFSLTRVAWDLPCPTITATDAQGRGGLIHPEENRCFTISELKRLSALPDDFRLFGTFAQRGERIGRMVPPLMLKALAESIYKGVLRPQIQ